MTAYFTGVWPFSSRSVGHYCYVPGGDRITRYMPASPWHSHYAPLGEVEAIRAGWGAGGYRDVQQEGIGLLVVKDGWTLLTLWDRSGDSRSNSSASFAVWALMTPEGMVAKMRELFPEVWARIDARLEKIGATLTLGMIR